ncbi:MAG TPA: RluA family pseudouridine synthase [Anaerolineae bacterium]|nr:RluA family pseudouridine synthase [Anaerolineae bacterium]
MNADQLHTLLVEAGEGGRLDRLVAGRVADLSRTAVQRLIDDGFITLNGSICKASDKVEQGDVIVVRVPPPVPAELIAEDIPLTIVYEDDDVVVIDKPAGLVVHPAAGHDSGTLVNALLGHIPDLEGIGGEVRPGIVHRLDKDTSGLIIAAKNDRALQFLQEQFKSRTIKKMYLALVEGIVEPREGIIDAPIGRSKTDRKKMAVTREGRSARTRYRVRQIYRQPDLSLVEAYPETGRTHQIRVHFAWVKHPLVGDEVYGRQRSIVLIERHFLHAAALALTLPNGEAHTFTSKLPDDLQDVLNQLTAAEK